MRVWRAILGLVAANLFHHGVDAVAVFHIVIVWRLVRSKTFTVKQESNRVHLQTSSLAKRLENLLELGGRAHLEVHLSVFLRRSRFSSVSRPTVEDLPPSLAL